MREILQKNDAKNEDQNSIRRLSPNYASKKPSLEPTSRCSEMDSTKNATGYYFGSNARDSISPSAKIPKTLTLSIKRTAMISEMPYENHWTFVSENKSILKRDKITTTTRKSKESAASEKRKLHVAFGNHGTSSNGKQNLSIQSTA